MDPGEAFAKLNELLALDTEYECVEFKTAGNDFTFDKLGKYFSALSNESNLKNAGRAWLVFGVNKAHKVVGTNYLSRAVQRENIKHQIAQHTALNITFREVHVVRHPDGRALMMEIVPTPSGTPMSWRGHCYARDGESLVALNSAKYDEIKDQARHKPDWSAAICKAASLDDLDHDAVTKARAGFCEKFAAKAAECAGWSDRQFLDKTKLTRGGQVTNSALLLVGKAESSHHLSPADPRILWALKRPDGTNANHEMFGPPFVLSVDQLFSKVRNNRYQFMRDGTLFPIDLLQYDAWIIREMLHNCIAHQDYAQHRRINVIEREGSLTFSNAGSFMPGSVELVVAKDEPQDKFRNRFLTEAMSSINMIETLGSGIPRVYRIQRQRGFPMTDYDLSDATSVSVRVHGQVLDENYTRALLENPDIELLDVIALDKVQKGVRLESAAYTRLRKRGLIEGTLRAGIRVVVSTAGASDKGDERLSAELLRHIESGQGKSSVLARLMIPALPKSMSEQQKKNKVRNLIQQLARDGRIENIGKAGPGAVWSALKRAHV
jgi:ATP-dependent DNA helicase RecG